MSSYLDDYDAGAARRTRLRNRILAGVLIVAGGGGGLYFQFRNYREESRSKLFFDHLRSRRYEQAYEVWGCTAATPCRSYSFKMFLDDWGPKSEHADLSKMQVVKTRSCSEGIIQALQFDAKEKPLLLWVNRGDLTLSYAPWPSCDPHIPTPE